MLRLHFLNNMNKKFEIIHIWLQVLIFFLRETFIHISLFFICFFLLNMSTFIYHHYCAVKCHREKENK